MAQNQSARSWQHQHPHQHQHAPAEAAPDTPAMFPRLVDALTAAATLTLRFLAVVFVRHHPLGPRYLPRIYSSFALSLAGFAAQLVHSRGRRPRRRRFLAPFLGWLDPARPVSTAFGVAINCLCVAACLDFVYRAHLVHQSSDLAFSRVGYVDDTTARVVVRAPWDSADHEIVAVLIATAAATAAGASQTIPILRKDDFVGTFHIGGLVPDTTYSYVVKNAGQPDAEPASGHALQGSFRTLPRPVEHPKLWSLVSTSCIKPFYPYNPLAHGLTIPGLEHLSSYLSSPSSPAPGPDLMLFLGDFIYIDLPMPVGWDRAAYTTAYRQVYASPSWTPRLRSMAWLHAYDDHEIRNDWAANETGLYRDAMAPFQAYQGRANPPPPAAAGVAAGTTGETYYRFRRGDVSFFVLDTRRYRSGADVADGPDKTMLGARQLRDLLMWLQRRGDDAPWNVLVSSVPFTRNWRGPDQADSWSGYLWERNLILDAMKRNGGAVILSGDRHEHATTLFPAFKPGDTPVIEFSTSPLSQFYEPFDRYHKEMEDTDISIHAHPWGNSKFGVVTFDTSEQGRLLVHYDLVVDGQKTWEYDWENIRK